MDAKHEVIMEDFIYDGSAAQTVGFSLCGLLYYKSMRWSMRKRKIIIALVTMVFLLSVYITAEAEQEIGQGFSASCWNCYLRGKF